MTEGQSALQDAKVSGLGLRRLRSKVHVLRPVQGSWARLLKVRTNTKFNVLEF